MSIRVRRYKRGGWEVDGRFRMPNGVIERFKLKSPCTSKAASERWGEEVVRTRIADALRPPVVAKEVPTLEEFTPRFVEGHCVANRHKPSGIEDKRSKLRVHLVPALGTKRLNQITSEDVPAVEGEPVVEVAENGEQHHDRPALTAQDGRGVGRDRPDALRRAGSQSTEANDGLSGL